MRDEISEIMKECSIKFDATKDEVYRLGKLNEPEEESSNRNYRKGSLRISYLKTRNYQREYARLLDQT